MDYEIAQLRKICSVTTQDGAVRTVAVLLSLEYTYGRHLLSGLLEALQKQSNWRVRLLRSQAELQQMLAGGFSPDAVVGMLWRDQVKSLKAAFPEIPIVTFARESEPPEAHSVCVDDVAVGHLAAAELRWMGLRRLAVYCPEDHTSFQLRAQGFLSACEQQSGQRPLVLSNLEEWQTWSQANAEPIGLFAVNDVHACTILENCAMRGQPAVPASCSVLGADDDEVFVHLVRVLCPVFACLSCHGSQSR
ncbi:MAG: substrate-binding domain-containing protein [Verrucomicrobia bacterium]|nr:substrate-binding domain-containing protein [Verrucomicrobiota bacterium]